MAEGDGGGDAGDGSAEKGYLKGCAGVVRAASKGQALLFRSCSSAVGLQQFAEVCVLERDLSKQHTQASERESDWYRCEARMRGV